MFMQHATAFRAAEKIGLSLHGLNLRPEVSAAGVVAGTLVETEAGWRPVERLCRGIRVATYDGGFSPVARVERRHLWPAAEVEVIHVPGGALDNCAAFAMLPGQHVFLASVVAEAVLGAGGALVAASALVGHFGITRRRLFRPVEVFCLHFTDEEIVYVNSGTLVHCAAERPGGPAGMAASADFDVLDDDRAQAMLALVAAGTLATSGIGLSA